MEREILMNHIKISKIAEMKNYLQYNMHVDNIEPLNF